MCKFLYAMFIWHQKSFNVFFVLIQFIIIRTSVDILKVEILVCNGYKSYLCVLMLSNKF